jgi:hypothetical protein
MLLCELNYSNFLYPCLMEPALVNAPQEEVSSATLIHPAFFFLFFF